MGVPVVFLDSRSKGAEAYKAFAWEFMAKNPTRGFMPESAPQESAPQEEVAAVSEEAPVQESEPAVVAEAETPSSL
jgi:hypothetical protein